MELASAGDGSLESAALQPQHSSLDGGLNLPPMGAGADNLPMPVPRGASGAPNGQHQLNGPNHVGGGGGGGGGGPNHPHHTSPDLELAKKMTGMIIAVSIVFSILCAPR